MTPLEKIDFIFLYLKDKTQYGGSWGYHNIENHVVKTPEADISITLLKEILERLKRDKLITESPLTQDQSVYHLTFDGVLFEGYKKAELNRQKEEERTKFLAEKMVTLSDRMARLTRWIALGTLIMAGYSIFEILKYLICVYLK